MKMFVELYWNGYTIYKVHPSGETDVFHYEAYKDDKFVCSGDTVKEVREELDNLDK